MMLSSAQAAQILTEVTGHVSPATLTLITQLVHQNTASGTLGDGDPYPDIRAYSKAFLDRLIQLGTGISTPKPENETLAVYMEKESVTRILSEVPENGYLAALPGLHVNEDEKTELTVSLLACDNDMLPVAGHQTGTLPGEECWKNISLLKNMNAVLPL